MNTQARGGFILYYLSNLTLLLTVSILISLINLFDSKLICNLLLRFLPTELSLKCFRIENEIDLRCCKEAFKERWRMNVYCSSNCFPVYVILD